MTDHLPIADAADAAVHDSPLTARLRVLHELAPVLHLITTPQAARAVEALYRAERAGVPAAEYEGLIAGLHGLAARHEALARQNGTGPQPAFPPAPPADGSEGM